LGFDLRKRDTIRERLVQVLKAAPLLARLRAAPPDTEGLRTERKRISREIAVCGRDDVLRLGFDLLAGHAPRWVVYELIRHHAATVESLTAREVVQLGKGMATWADIDTFACYVSGQAWRAGCLRDAEIGRWAKSEDWTWRRAALVSTVPLNSRAQGGSGDTQRTIAICKLLIDDRADLVVKALSWALRELSKRDPTAVRAFLDEHGGRLAARVLREVTCKLTTGRKN